MAMIQWQARTIQLLSVAGIVVAFYLVLFHNGELAETGCGIGQFWDCGSVSGPTAPYSKIATIPVAYFGLGGYVAIFLMVWLSDFVAPIRHNLRELLMATITLALMFTGYLTYLEAFVLHAWCLYCVYSAVIVVVMFVLAGWMLFAKRTGG